ncbi:hypothetical protein AAG747_04670 [Rapidithrix thailandica]|uniref:Ubiquinone biosynthesis protein COQ4 n=1 Tax=Rapidithrix thailandica TaxID=413964 RepID=A0AAW9S767_9BACT
MTSISIYQRESTQALNFREKIVEGLKVWMVIKPLQFLFRRSMENHTIELQNSQKGTVGYDIYQLLKKHDLKVIPKFENHDLKHLILGYGMSSIDEIRMQMYLLGNGNYSIFCLLFAASGILFPKAWSSFYQDYRKGKSAPSILDLSIHDCKVKKTKELKNTYNKVYLK